MITHPRFPVEPWRVREVGLGDLDVLAQSESIFALSNGHIGVRGNLDEGDPHGLPGTYLNSFYDRRPLPQAEAAYGDPESNQVVHNVGNGKLIRLLVGDEPFDVRYGQLLHHERSLDLRAGTLSRVVDWRSPAGRRVRVRSTRLVSLTHRALLAIRYEVEAVDEPVRLVVQSELLVNEPLPAPTADPRSSTGPGQLLAAVSAEGSGTRARLVHRAETTDLQVAVAMDHELDDGWTSAGIEVGDDRAVLTLTGEPAAGTSVVFTKYVAYGWSGSRSEDALLDQVDAALVTARTHRWPVLVADQRHVLDEFWAGADVEVDGSPEVQQAVRFSLFHAFQAAWRAEQRAVPAKGLTGSGYDGHSFWDTEMFVLPMLVATAPKAAADALRWRAGILEPARVRARTLKLRGAAFPWRTIHGEECAGYWPAGSAAVHVTADVALAARRYVDWTGDLDFDRECALPILVDSARFWRSIGYVGADGQFHIDGVTGPDEYSALGDDNTYTNVAAAQTLLAAAEAVHRWPAEARELDADADEAQGWSAAAEAMAVCRASNYDGPEPSRGYTRHEWWDFQASVDADAYPLLLNVPYSQLYRKQVIKQADLVLALHWFGDRFTDAEKAEAFSYCEALTVRDSSLSACTQAVVAAEVGHLDLALDYLSESSRMDLDDLEHNTRDGLHLAALAGTWLALIAGLGGLRDHGGQLRFRPQLPDGWSRLRFRLCFRGVRLSVTLEPSGVTYAAADGAGSLSFQHDGEELTLAAGESVVRPLVRVKPLTPRPTQPVGRAPLRS